MNANINDDLFDNEYYFINLFSIIVEYYQN